MEREVPMTGDLKATGDSREVTTLSTVSDCSSGRRRCDERSEERRAKRAVLKLCSNKSSEHLGHVASHCYSLKLSYSKLVVSLHLTVAPSYLLNDTVQVLFGSLVDVLGTFGKELLDGQR